MRILVTALLSTAVLLGSSCGKERKDDSRDRRFVSFKLDNKIYLSKDPKGIIHAPNFTDDDPLNDYPKMEISGQTYSGDLISLTLVAPVLPFKPGIYPCSKQGNSIIMVTNSNMPATLASGGSNSCFITISRIDNVNVEGSFSGPLRDISSISGSRTVRDGAFRAIITTISQ
ncbi:hypothetical protein [Chitinophaga solisilvae]|uniref:hypothetical protein n=1 Tax=Chitinophaga solisilvae TaxID=1233460 RepID=UPI001370B7BB|nr:hypothetical protein [Chitinophaga solisilvae]